MFFQLFGAISRRFMDFYDEELDVNYSVIYKHGIYEDIPEQG